jgi:hypothetical protein
MPKACRPRRRPAAVPERLQILCLSLRVAELIRRLETPFHRSGTFPSSCQVSMRGSTALSGPVWGGAADIVIALNRPRRLSPGTRRAHLSSSHGCDNNDTLRVADWAGWRRSDSPGRAAPRPWGRRTAVAAGSAERISHLSGRSFRRAIVGVQRADAVLVVATIAIAGHRNISRKRHAPRGFLLA